MLNPFSKNAAPAIFGVMREALDARKRLIGLIATAEAEESRAVGAYDNAQARIEAEEAELAIAGGTGISNAGRIMQEAHMEAETAAARVRGLRAKLETVNAQLREQYGAFQAARAEWSRQAVESFAPEYMKAVQAFQSATRKALALGLALNDETIIRVCHQNMAFGLIGGEFILEQPRNPQYGPTDYSPAWQQDARAVALHAEKSGPRELAEQLDKELASIREEPARAVHKIRDAAAAKVRAEQHEEMRKLPFRSILSWKESKAV